MGKGVLDTKAKKLAAADRKRPRKRVSPDGRAPVIERALKRVGLSYSDVATLDEEALRKMCEALAEERFVEMTPKQSRWLVEYVATGNAMEAARRAYGDVSRESHVAVAYHNKKVLRDYIIDIFDLLGLDVLLTAEKLFEGLNATKVFRAVFQGKITAEVEDVDFRTRHDYLDMLLRLRGAYAPERHVISEGAREVETPEAQQARVDAYKRMLEEQRGGGNDGDGD